MLKRSCAFAACLLAVPVVAQTPRARVDAVLKTSEFPSIPPLADAPAPPTPRAVPAYVAEAVINGGSLWARLRPLNTLSAADHASASYLARSLGFNEPMVRVLTRKKAEDVLDRAIRMNPRIGPLRFFTDPAFQRYYSYYVTGDDLRVLFRDFEIKALAPILGRATDGRPVNARGLLIGHGVVAVLYDRPFKINQYDHVFGFDPLVVQKIDPNASLSLRPISGVYIFQGSKFPVLGLNEHWIDVWHTNQRLKAQTPISRRRARS